MGLERAVTRWYVERRLLLDEIAVVKQQQAQVQVLVEEASSPDQDEKLAHLTGRLHQLSQRLLALGPCPQPKMG